MENIEGNDELQGRLHINTTQPCGRTSDAGNTVSLSFIFRSEHPPAEKVLLKIFFVGVAAVLALHHCGCSSCSEFHSTSTVAFPFPTYHMASISKHLSTRYSSLFLHYSEEYMLHGEASLRFVLGKAGDD